MNSPSQQTIADLSFDSLNTVSGLKHFDRGFLAVLADREPSLHRTLLAYRQQKLNLTAIELSEFLLALAPYVEAYIALNFGIENETEASQKRINNEKAIHLFNKQFIPFR